MILVNYVFSYFELLILQCVSPNYKIKRLISL